MRSIIAILILMLATVTLFAGDSILVGVQVYTLDQALNPELVDVDIESVLVVLYADDGVTVRESLYTSTTGFGWFSKDTFDLVYCQLYAEKTAYASGTNDWSRFYADTTIDTLVIPVRMYSTPSGSTITIVVYTGDSEGQPASGESVVMTMHAIPTFYAAGGSDYIVTDATKTKLTNAAGNAIFTLIKHARVTFTVGDYSIYEDADTNKVISLPPRHF